MRNKEKIFRMVAEAESTTEIERLIKDLNSWLEKEPGDIVLLEHKGMLYEKLQQYGNAINEYRKILNKEPNHKQAIAKTEMLATILRFSNTDIYASPNTNLDPWME